MDIRIKATDFEMNSQVQDYLDDRLLAIEKHMGGDAEIARCEVELGRAAGHSQTGENWFAELQVHVPGNDVVRVVAYDTTVNAAIDAAKDELLGRLKKDRTKRFARTRKAGAKIKEWLRFGSRK